MGQTLSIPDVEALPGETVSYSLNINVGEGAYTGYQYQMQFPATGFTLTGETTTYSGWQNASLTVGNLVSGVTNASAYSSALKNIPTGDIEIGTVEFTVGTGVATGEYDVTISNFNFLDGTNYYPVADVTFKVKVVSVHTVELDELATTAPSAIDGVNVKVKRTIKANEWSTICLPFAMTEAQVKTAFGDDVLLKDFNGITTMTDTNEDIISIQVNFNPATAIEANHPYVIKLTSKAITYEDGFIVEGVDIAPTGELSVDKDETNVKIGKNWYTLYNSLIGNYVAETVVPNDCLFLSGNKFWYSNGNTKMKGFRAYFDFQDILADKNANARISFNFDETTGIKEVHGNANVDGTYDLQGRKVEKPANKGLYIVNGKKVVIK